MTISDSITSQQAGPDSGELSSRLKGVESIGSIYVLLEEGECSYAPLQETEVSASTLDVVIERLNSFVGSYINEFPEAEPIRLGVSSELADYLSEQLYDRKGLILFHEDGGPYGCSYSEVLE